MQATVTQPGGIRLIHKSSARRRRRARTLKVLAAVLLSVLFLFVAPRAVEMMSHTEAPVIATYTVDSGDTLWAIATRFYPNGDVRDMVAAIKAANHLQTATVHAGQELVIPKLHAN
jgi:nucleoid-associated protein YgaU